MSDPMPTSEFMKAILHEVGAFCCGSCKGTGVEHEWTSTGDLRPTDPPRACLICHGTGRPDQ